MPSKADQPSCKWASPEQKMGGVFAKKPAPAPEPLTEKTIATVKATIPALREHGVAIITRFYSLLFEKFPDAKKHFNMDRQAGGKVGDAGVPAQIASLARAVLLYAQNVDTPEVLLPTVKSIANKHVSRGVVPPQYDAVGACLLEAISDTLGAAATPAIMDAWGKAYGKLAAIFISVEAEIKKTAAKRAGYEGFLPMPVIAIEDAGDGKIIAVKPEGKDVPGHEAGMYAAISLEGVEGVGATMLTADIKTKNTDTLKLSVAASGEAANEFLLATVKVGDMLSVGMPCGEPTK